MFRLKPESQAIALLLLLTLIWGTSFILIKKGLAAFSPDVVAALRVSAAALVLAPVAVSLRREISRNDLPKLLLSGMLGIFIPAFLFAFAQQHMESSAAGILNTLTPLFTMLIGARLFHQRFSLLAITGIILGFAGAVILSLSRSGHMGSFNAWSLLIVVACSLYATNLNYIKFSLQGFRALTITSFSVFLIGPFALGYLFLGSGFLDQLTTQPAAISSLFFVVLLGVMSTAVATILFNKLVKISTPLFASSVTYLMPVVALLWGFLDHEQLTWGHFAGLTAILGGVYLANRKR